jgi:uncharacterized membrane-anchored protein
MRRKQLAAMRANQKKEQMAEIDARRDALATTLQQSVVDGKMTEKQMEEILREYNESLVKLQEKHDLGVWNICYVIVYFKVTGQGVISS